MKAARTQDCYAPGVTPFGFILAAVAGVILGIGLMLFRSTYQVGTNHQARVEEQALLRSFVIPVLERRAEALAIPKSERGGSNDSPLQVTVKLAKAIEQLESQGTLPFSDTLEASRQELEASAPPTMKGGSGE